MNRKGRLFFWAIAVFSLVFVSLADSLPPGETHNRPNPLIDYVPQEIGIFDGSYESLEEEDCRRCHGNSTTDRHHYSNLALSDTTFCSPCHQFNENGIVVESNCTAMGCHSNFDLGPKNISGIPPNGWHHNTWFSFEDKCTACHDSDLIDHITYEAAVTFDLYPPTVVTPSPFGCENCHWEQPVVQNAIGWENGQQPPFPLYEQAGHPSTYDHNEPGNHYNVNGSVTPNIPADEYHEYGKKVESNHSTHHTLQHDKANVDATCARCHSVNPNDPAWDPFNPELIRYCETCHSAGNLHKIEPHVGTGGQVEPLGVNGWEAVGFHMPDTTNTDTTDVVPTVYRPFSANHQCYGCHADSLPAWFPPLAPDLPRITDITPKLGSWDHRITLTGESFGSEITPARSVWIKATSTGDWSQVPIWSWTTTRIEFIIPCRILTIGNYYVRIQNEKGSSNVVVLTLQEGGCGLCSITPTAGKCREIITVSGYFSYEQDTSNLASGKFGVYRAVQIVGPAGSYIASAYGAWSPEDFKFRLGDMYEDVDHDFLRDPNESLIRLCEGFSVGEYAVYVKGIYYQDMDGTNDYSEGDVIQEVGTSGPASFTLEAGPAIYAVYPQHVERSHYCPDGSLVNGVAKIQGWGFGPSQDGGIVYIGTGPMYASDSGLALNRVVWSDNLIKVGVDVPPGAKGMALYLWVEKDGQKTDASYGWPGIRILSTETCP